MFSICSELTPRAHIPDTRIPQLMEPWPFKFSFYQSTLRHSCLCLIKLYVATFCIIVIIIIIYPLLNRRRFLQFLSYSFLFKPSPPFGDIHLTLPPPSSSQSHWIKHHSNDYQIFPWTLSPCFTTSTTSPLVSSRSFPLSSWFKPVLSFTKVVTMISKPYDP